MTAPDRCTNIMPHPAHSRFGLKDCPGVPVSEWTAAADQSEPAPAEGRVQLAVEYADHQTRYYPVNRGWRIDAARRCIVIGTDLPRIYVPLDGVFAFTVEQVAPAARPVDDCERCAAHLICPTHDAPASRRADR